MIEHTEGELKASGNGIHIGMKCIAVTHAESKELRDADARRIAACWNACAGIQTEYLEKFGGTTFNDFKRVKQQRDELLAAARSAILALAFAASKDATFQSDYEKFSEAIAKATA